MTPKALTYRFIKLFVLISTFLLVLSSCDIIDSIFGSEDDDVNGTVGPGYGLIGTQVIGSTGGEINLDSIIVNVPSGAFDENTEISISVGEDNDGFDEYGISSLYQISGLPSTINKPVRISIKYHGTLEGDTLVALGEMQYSTSLDSSLYSYQAENASDSSGYLVYDLPAYSSLARSTQPLGIYSNSGTKNIIALGKYTMSFSSGRHFLLCYPMTHKPDAILMGEYFETAYIKCKAMEFSYTARTSWPVNVLTKRVKKNYAGRYSYKISHPNGKKTVTDAELRSFINRGRFTINLAILSDDLKLRTAVGHEFLHLVQNCYEFSAPNIEPEQKWLKEATAVWIMEKYSNMSNYIPMAGFNMETYPFDGWQYSDAKRSHARHGYGLSVIFKDIVEVYGESAIVKIFEKVKSGILPSNATDPVDAVLSILNESVGNFWHGILGAYVLGHYYNSQVNFKFLDKSTSYKGGIVTIDPVNNKIPITLPYHDLSGKLFKIQPGDFSTLITVPLSFTVNDSSNCGILVCMYKQGSEITPIGEVFPGGSGVVILNDAKPIFDAGYELVVLVSNSSHNKSKNYQETKDIELVIEIVNTEIVGVVIDIYIDNATSRESDGGVWTTYPDDATYSFYLSSGFGYPSSDRGTGSMNNNVYTATFDKTGSLVHTISGHMSITFLDDPSRINIHVDRTRTQSYLSYNITEKTLIDYDGIPLYADNYYYESGSAVSKISLRYSDVASGSNNHVHEYVSHSTCSDDAYIEVRVYYQFL